MPGFMQRADAWAPIAARIGRGRRIATVELETPSLDACVDAIRRGGGGGVVVAYSMGGRVALHAAVRDPRAYRALVLVGATPGMEDERLRRSRRAADGDLAEWMADARIDAVVDFWQSQPVFATQSPELVSAQRPGRLAHDPRRLAQTLRALGQGALPPLWDRVPELPIPVLAVAGERDEKYADVAARMAAAIPLGRAALVPDAGHAPQLEQPDAFAELLVDFLDEHLG